MQRIMGLDLGNKTIGVAISDSLGITAQGHEVLHREGNEKDLHRLSEIIVAYDVDTIVIGMPKNMNNTIGPQGEITLAFANELQQHTSCKIVFWDERLTTKAAKRQLQAGGLREKQSRKIIDMVAATLILQSYLDSQ